MKSIRGIPRQFDQDLTVMSQIFSVIFYIKLPVQKYIHNFFKDFFDFDWECIRKASLISVLK